MFSELASGCFVAPWGWGTCGMVFGQELTTVSLQRAYFSYLKICQCASCTVPKYLGGTLSGRSFTVTTLYPTLIVISLPFRRPVQYYGCSDGTTLGILNSKKEKPKSHISFANLNENFLVF